MSLSWSHQNWLSLYYADFSKYEICCECGEIIPIDGNGKMADHPIFCTDQKGSKN